MKIAHGIPPNMEKILKVLDPDFNMVFTYGDTLYCPMPGAQPSDDLMVHEETHAKQQTHPDEWWDKYLADPKFRLEQELEAYRAQYEYIKKHKNWKRWDLYQHAFAKDLSSHSYGDIITYQEAREKIRES